MENSRKIEFSIEFIRNEKNRFFVAGRCYQGPILIGDTFTYLYQLIPQKIGDEYLKSLRITWPSLNLKREKKK